MSIECRQKKKDRPRRYTKVLLRYPTSSMVWHLTRGWLLVKQEKRRRTAFLAFPARRLFPRVLCLSSSCITIHGITNTGLPTPGGREGGRVGGWEGGREGGREERREGGGQRWEGQGEGEGGGGSI